MQLLGVPAHDPRNRLANTGACIIEFYIVDVYVNVKLQYCSLTELM